APLYHATRPPLSVNCLALTPRISSASVLGSELFCARLLVARRVKAANAADMKGNIYCTSGVGHSLDDAPRARVSLKASPPPLPPTPYIQWADARGLEPVREAGRGVDYRGQ